MEEFDAAFCKSQDLQLENLRKKLEEYRKLHFEQIESLDKLAKDYNEREEAVREKYAKMQSELENIFSKVEEYEEAIDRLEKIVENSEKDLFALEEYCDASKTNAYY